MPIKILKPLSHEAYRDVLGCIRSYAEPTKQYEDLEHLEVDWDYKAIFPKLDNPFWANLWIMHTSVPQHRDSTGGAWTLGIVLSGSAKLYSGSKTRRYEGTLQRGSVFVLKNTVMHGADLVSEEPLLFITLDFNARTMKRALSIVKETVPIVNIDSVISTFS